MAAKLGTNMTYTQSNKLDRLTKLYIDAKRNPGKLLDKEASEWRSHVCEPTRENPYGTKLSFLEAYEKYILPELSYEKREDLRIIVGKIPESKVYGINRDATAEEEELVFTPSDHKLLLERLDQLELEVAMLKSQNAFADVVGK